MTIRLYEPRDETALQAIHARQCAGIGADYPFPDLRDPRYYRVFVVEQDGEVAGAIVCHLTTELFAIADNPQVIRAVLNKREAVEEVLRQAGADELHAFVPNGMVAKMKSILRRAGFRRSNENFTTFYREV